MYLGGTTIKENKMEKVYVEDIMKETKNRKRRIQEQLDYLKNMYKPVEFDNIEEALEDDWRTLEKLSPLQQTKEICLMAMDISPYAIMCIHNQTEELCLYAVTKMSSVLEYCKVQTAKVIKEALEKKRFVLDHVVNPNYSIYKYYVLWHPEAVAEIMDIEVVEKLNKIDWDREVMTITDVKGKEHLVFISDILVGFSYRGEKRDTFLIEISFSGSDFSIEVSREEANRVRDFLDR